MAFFFHAVNPHEEAIYPEFLDGFGADPFPNVKLEADPDTLDLRASEAEILSGGGSGMNHG